MEFGNLTVLVIVISLLERTYQRESLTASCESVLVSGADRCGCDGVYNITTQIKLKWPKGKPVYQNVDKKRFMYFNSQYYGWGLSTQKGLQNYNYFYSSRLNTSGPTMGVWRPIRNKSRNISVICQDPILNKNSGGENDVSDIFHDLVSEAATVNGFGNDSDRHFLSSSSPVMHKESFTILKALIITCAHLVFLRKRHILLTLCECN